MVQIAYSLMVFLVILFVVQEAADLGIIELGTKPLAEVRP